MCPEAHVCTNLNPFYFFTLDFFKLSTVHYFHILTNNNFFFYLDIEKTTISIDEAQGYTFKCGISKPMITWIDWKINGKSIKKVDKKEIKCHVINNRELVIKKKSISKVSRISYTAATERFDVTETFEIGQFTFMRISKFTLTFP